MKKALSVAAAAMLLCACSQTEMTENGISSDSESAQSNVDTQEHLTDFDEKYATYQKKYPDKQILTWLTDSYVRYEAELNQYLADNGFDYVVCFKTLDMSSDYGDTYISAVKATPHI